MDDLLTEFLTETSESLSVLDLELVQLEQNPNDPNLLGNIFRLVHTIKGTCGFLGLPRLEAVAHASENVLGKIRDGELDVAPSTISTVLESIDRIKWLLSELESKEVEPEGDDGELISRLNAIVDGDAGAAPAPAAAEEAAPDPEVVVEADASADESIEMIIDDGAAEVPANDEPAAEAASEDAAQPAEAQPADTQPADSKPADSKPAAAAAPANEATAEAGGNAKESAVANQTIRVRVNLLESLMTLVSELVLTRNQLLQMVRNQSDSEFVPPLQRLSHVTSELQENVMKTRMQPIGNAWSKLPRIVRDLAVELDKKIDLEMVGADTELDRQVLDLIKDPLTHMVRNSADHGLETPDERKQAGKPDTGKIVLRAYHEGGHIIIEISDDGRGLNLEKIKKKIVDNGLSSEEALEGMSDQQIQQFIFRAGFSTAQSVTSVSGRGVGMDVVRTNIEQIGGTIELNSTEGNGSQFIIKIPLTLAIVSALIVECGGERFAMPQLSVVELVRVSANSEHRIEMINQAPVLRLRDRILPLVSLRDILGLGGDTPARELGLEDDDANADDADSVKSLKGAANGGGKGEKTLHGSSDHFIVVTRVGANVFGIVVDRVFDTEEIVVKPVAPILRNITMFSGNTILGDGSVIMILDPNGIAASTGESVIEKERLEAKAARAKSSDDQIAMLVFKAGDNCPKAVPLALIARLEEIDIDKIEWSGGRPMVQYRGGLMPLISISEDHEPKTEGQQPILVFADDELSMGLIVDEIIDIVEDHLKVELSGDKPGYIGSAVIEGKATDILDAGYYLDQAHADWFRAVDSADTEDDRHKREILLVDDSPFFRNMLNPLLNAAGYSVTAVESGQEALALCESGKVFDVIVSDIEMPDMNGFELAEAVRDSLLWKSTPIIALSSHSTPRDLERGRAVGFDDYVSKTDRDGLLMTLSETITSERGAA